MVGRAVDDLYPRTPRHPGDALLEVDGVSRDRSSCCTAARSSASPASSAPDARGCCARSSVSSRSGRDAFGSGHGSDRRRPGASGTPGVGMLSEDRKGEGLALGLSVADNLTASRLDGLGPGRDRPAVAPGPRGAPLDRSRRASAAPVRGSRSSSCRAAISRRSRSPACSITTSTRCCSTSRRAASTSRSKAQI